MYFVTKEYGHDRGLSCAFRQWRATSHCRFIHGYALAFKFTFAANELDANGWVIDFGSLKPLEAWLREQFDHKTLIATDDPNCAELISDLRRLGVADVKLVKRTGCEAFAATAGNHAMEILHGLGLSPRVSLVKVECKEHGSNSAGLVYTGGDA